MMMLLDHISPVICREAAIYRTYFFILKLTNSVKLTNNPRD